MAKGTRRRIGSRRCKVTPYPLPSSHNSNDLHAKDCPKITAIKDWEDATCSVCMEYPHNAVLLLCSSHDKGCHPYMCGTSFRYSNCLDQYKKAHTKSTSPHNAQSNNDSADSSAVGAFSNWAADKCEVTELACPLCRGQVKGWTVVKPARDYLNSKNRCCMQDNCLFSGTYKELRKHVKADHPLARPREVDPLLEQKWSRLEHEREREDVISTITSSMPGAVVFGDYVIERNHVRFESDEEDGFDADAMDRIEGFDVGIDQIESNFMNVFLLLQAFDSARNNRDPRRHGRDRNRTLDESTIGFDDASTIGGFDNFELTDTDDDGRGNQGNTIVDRLQREGRVFLPRGGRRRRRREPHGSRRGVDRLIGE
ncbi:hypothetical protein LIER_23654 [Lithospermum erythrorhizon]|uniref:C2H2-type domain-containing protein n=1 Tax=Lithospermum erythrorhizon TaxID=34254 RepID=A0AAV3R1W2_LITER